jgi:N-methylhydantoinase A
MTLATNAVLEGKGVKVGLVTTQGYRDVLALRRGNRTVLYDMRFRPPPPLVPRNRVHEVQERILFDGTTLHPIDRTTMRQVAERLQAQGVEAVAICFLHSYVNDANEQIAAEVIQDSLPAVFVSTQPASYRSFASTNASAPQS